MNSNNSIIFYNKEYLYNLYFKIYIRFKINKINNINDIIFIINKINYYYSFRTTTDIILNFLLETLSLYPLTEKEMQIISIIQQAYQFDIDIYGYVSLTLWIAIIEHIKDKSL
tara:strand:+ start:1884 stop:2222 length:339 start_codon:yes stop_codon:yes gene_type:complete